MNDKHSCQTFRMGWRDKTTPTLTTPLIRANMSCVVATIFSSLAFLSLSISMVNLSRLVAASFSSLALLSSSISTANLSCLLVTTFSSLRFLSNSFSSPRFNHLRVARRCFLWFSVFSFYHPKMTLKMRVCHVIPHTHFGLDSHTDQHYWASEASPTLRCSIEISV